MAIGESPYGDVRSPTSRVRTRLIVADDHQAVREGLCSLLSHDGTIDVVGQAGTTDETLAEVQALRPDVLILDLAMPTSGGFEAMQRVRRVTPDVAIVVLTRYQQPEYVRQALRDGAAAYVVKRSSFKILRQAIETVATRGRYVDAELAAGVTQGPGRDRITEREREVLQRAVLGYANKAIAQALHIAIKTVEVHKAQAMRKLALENRRALLRYAMLRGWLQEP